MSASAPPLHLVGSASRRLVIHHVPSTRQPSQPSQPPPSTLSRRLCISSAHHPLFVDQHSRQQPPKSEIWRGATAGVLRSEYRKQEKVIICLLFLVRSDHNRKLQRPLLKVGITVVMLMFKLIQLKNKNSQQLLTPQQHL